MRLHAKIILLIALVVLGVGAGCFLLTERVFRNAMEKELEEKAVIVAQVLAEHISHNVVDGEVVPAREALLEIVRRTKDVDYIFITGFDNEIFAHSFENGFPRDFVHEAHENLRADAPRRQKFRVAGVPILQVEYPLVEGMLAQVHVGMNETHVHSQVGNLRNRILGISLAVMLVGIMLGAYISRRITRPLTLLSDSLSAFGKGERGEKIAFRGGGREVAGLTRSFNRMISDREGAVEALRESEERFRTIINTSKDAMVVIDRAGLIRLFNPAAERMFGHKGEEILGKPLDCLMPEKYRSQHQLDVDSFFSTGKPEGAIGRTLEVPAVRKNGEEFPVEISLAGGGVEEHAFVLGIMRDVTERKRAEKERLSLERQMQHAQKLESLGVLAGGIAHDFNNILMAILGNADLALVDLSPVSPARENLEEIEKAARRAAGLAKQMLAYSGKGKFVIEPIDLTELVEEMAHMLEVSISKKAVMKYNFAANLPPLEGDATQIRQIIMNLITNASEAIGDRSGVIAVSTGAMDCDRAYLEGVNEILRAGLEKPLSEGIYTYLEVADTGCGMDKETIEKIFDPFFTTKFMGRGLGMAAVLGILRGHRGGIKIYSELGEGSTFKILFPATEKEIPARKRPADREDSLPAFSGTVLIVDDEETVVAVGKRMLERMGFTVLTAADGREAVEIFRERPQEIACVLLDLTMPHLDGEQAFRELRRIREDVHVILCSGYNEQDATQRFAGKGLAGFLQKPYPSKSLKAKLREVLAMDAS